MTRLTKIAARKKIVSHLVRRGHVADFKVTPILVRRWWNLLNKAVFNGKLPSPTQIECKAYHNVWGLCIVDQNDEFQFKINSEFLDRKAFITVLAHEMVHQYEWVTYGRMTHGKNFFAWKPILKKQLDITLTA